MEPRSLWTLEMEPWSFWGRNEVLEFLEEPWSLRTPKTQDQTLQAQGTFQRLGPCPSQGPGGPFGTLRAHVCGPSF